MARKQLINLHSSVVKHPSGVTLNPEIAVGEIVIQAVKTAATIYTKVEDGSYAEFIDKAKVETLVAGVSSNVTELSGNVGTLSSETKTLESHFEAAVSGIGYTAGSIANYIEGKGFAKDEDLQTLSGTVTNALSEMQIDATHSVKTYVDNEIDSEESARKDEDSRLNNLITGVSTDLANATQGIGVSASSIANYIEGKGFAKNTDLQTLSGTVNTLSNDFTNVTSGFSGQNAIKNAIDNEADARRNKDTELENSITGLSTDFNNEIAKVLTGISAEGKNVYVEASATTKTDKTQTVEVKAIVAGPLSSMTASSGQLADAYFVKNYIDKQISDEATAREAVATNLANLTNDFKSETAFTSSELAKVLTAITAEGKNSYVSASATTKTDKVQGVEVTANVAGDLSGVSATGQLADAKRVKDYVDAGVSSAWTKANSVQSNLTDLENIVGDNSGYTSTHTITDVLASLEADAVRSVSVKNGGSGTGKNGITATEDAQHNVEFDFDNMVVDCGEY